MPKTTGSKRLSRAPVQRMRFRCVPAAGLTVLLLLALPCQSKERQQTTMNLPCIEQAAAFHGVNAQLLRAIFYVESRGNPSAIGKNTNGSIDVGLGQTNSIHFKELSHYGIAPEHLLDGCISSYVSAWHLAKQFKVYGNTWAAVGSYHSKTPIHRDKYAGMVYGVLRRWKALP